MAQEYIKSNFGSQVYESYSRIDPAYAPARSDLLRYLAAYCEGGVYLDIKSDASLPLDQVLLPSDTFLLSQWPVYRDQPAGTQQVPELRRIRGGEYVIWFLACEPNHPFLEAVVRDVISNIADYHPFVHGVGKPAVLRLSGPIAYTLSIEEIRHIHAHRVVNYESDLGFIVSIHGDHRSHENLYGRHYSTLVRPVVRQTKLMTFACEMWYAWCVPLAIFVRWKYDGVKRRVARLLGQ